MREHFKTLPNQLTAARLALIPVMWVLALFKLPAFIGVGLIICFITDALDGRIARRLGQTSEFGSKFDSFVDNLLLPSALVWLWLLRPEVYLDHLVLDVVAIIIYFASLLLGIVKFKRFANLHLYSSQYGTVVTFAFASHAFIAQTYSPLLFYAAIFVFIIASLETLLLQLICAEVNAHMGSIILVLKRRKTANDSPQ